MMLYVYFLSAQVEFGQSVHVSIAWSKDQQLRVLMGLYLVSRSVSLGGWICGSDMDLDPIHLDPLLNLIVI